MQEYRLLLISNSILAGYGFLDYCIDEIESFLRPITRVLFVPFALHNHAAYHEKVRARLQQAGLQVEALPCDGSAPARVAEASALYIGGGNTFRLLNRLYQTGIIPAIRERVNQGMPYIGISAGTNVACPSIKTTNDMPIMQPPSFEALNLVPFNINPHYLDPDPSSNHQGETRPQRIAEFHEENGNIVVGLREGAMLRIESGHIQLRGLTGAKIFRPRETPYEISPGTCMDFLLE
ncbi:MAG: dipeptidase PepE [Acidobacteria bacterium]|nr:dipeptidase PepE [Acidobacteriota bacterium]MBI3655863.1 dipeptidase PepE [Acidobacteriota bacterium]